LSRNKHNSSSLSLIFSWFPRDVPVNLFFKIQFFFHVNAKLQWFPIHNGRTFYSIIIICLSFISIKLQWFHNNIHNGWTFYFIIIICLETSSNIAKYHAKKIKMKKMKKIQFFNGGPQGGSTLGSTMGSIKGVHKGGPLIGYTH